MTYNVFSGTLNPTQSMLRYGDFSIFKVVAVQHLGYLKIQNFNDESGQGVHIASLCQSSWWSVGPLLRYGDLSIFKWVAVRCLGRIYWTSELVHCCMCLDHPQRVLGDVYHLQNSVVSTDSSRLLAFEVMCYWGYWKCASEYDLATRI